MDECFFLLYFDLYAYMGPVIWFNKIKFYSVELTVNGTKSIAGKIGIYLE